MKFHWLTELPQLLILGGMFVAAWLLWDRVPEQVPVHWNASGEADRFGGRFEGLVLVPLIGVGVYFVMLLAPLIDRKNTSMAGFQRMYGIIRLAVIVFLAVVYAASIRAFWSESHRLGPLFSLGLAGLFLVIGGCMRAIPPNPYAGVRTPWTLKSDYTWRKTHELAGWVFMGIGVCAGFCVWIDEAWVIYTTIGLSLLSLVIVVLGSYLFWLQAPDRPAT
ncbi:MAG: DUF1648 domain-containing protein [Planctomycetota bacterium]